MKRISLFFLLMGSLFACRSASSDPLKTGAGTGISYLALGDSYTIGESVDEADRYPNQLMELLKKKGVSSGAVKIVARTGWTTSELKSGIAAAGVEGQQFDLVTLLIGVNNEFRGQSLETFKTEFKALLVQAIGFAGGNKAHVFVVSIPDYGYTPYGKDRQPSISPRIDQFNAAALAIANELDVKFIDITPISRKGLSDPSLVAGDGLHPSGKQYKQWAELIAKEISD